jgi:hypothetical protein
VALTLVSLLAFFSPAPVAAVDVYTWSSCNWSLVDHGSSPNYTYRIHSFPADGWGDGVKNSFTDRILDAIVRANSQLAYVGRTGRLVPAPGQDERISFYYQAVSENAFGVTAINYTYYPGCTIHGTTSAPVFTAQIYVSVFPNWFTQDDTRRGYWETQCPAGTGTPYTCGKLWDVGSTVLHELQHALGVLYHPQDLGPDAPAAVAAARCDNIPLRATICPSFSYQWRSERRVLDPYDLGNLGSQEQHWP